MLAAERLAAGFGVAVALPETVAECGLPAALSMMVTAPVRAPVAVGVKVRLMAQVAPAGNDVPQVVARAKSPTPAMPVMVRAALPVFERLTVCAALVVAICWFPNATLAADRLRRGAAAAVPAFEPAGLHKSLRVIWFAASLSRD